MRILMISKDRFHDETAIGELGNATTSPKARISHSASYYDPANRLTDGVNVETNGGSSYTRSGIAPSRSDTVLITSYDNNAAGGGNIVNQIQRADNGLGQLITEHQSHSGAANINSTPKVQHAYTETSGGTNHSRPTSNPAGYVVNDNYSSGLNDTISPLSDTTKKSSGTDYLRSILFCRQTSGNPLPINP